MHDAARFPPTSARPGRHAVLCAVLLSWLVPVAAPPAAAEPLASVAAVSQPAAPVRPRPRIGLVLGGGGAKGAAHVGVLTLLDEMHIPVDCIVGTSMGALVGGTYASGMSAPEIERAIREINWQDTIALRSRREKLPMRRKQAGVTYSNNIEFGYKDRGLSAPSGFINTQNVEQTIRALVSRSLGVTNFDQLPIPFRAIATDMQRGEMVVLSSGDLAQSMRASMAVPGVFGPVTIDGRVLGDGGLTRNLPVDIARQTCADVVIAVSVPNPPPSVEDLQSPLTLVSRTLDVLIEANEKQQLDSLGPADVKIIVPMGNVGATSFEKVPEAIPLGRAAAEKHRAELARYALPEAEYQAWRDAHVRPEQRSVRLADVRIEGLDRVDPDYVKAHLDLRPGEVVDQRKIARHVDKLFALDDFASVQYMLRGDPENPDLVVQIKEKPWGPNILRFDLGISMGTDGSTAFSLGGDYLRPWLNSLGGELHGVAQIGRTSKAGLSLYQPLDSDHAWFVEPGVQWQRSLEDIYDDGETISRYEFQAEYAYLDFGREFSTRAEIRLGLRSGYQSARRDITPRVLPEINSEGYGGWTVEINYDDRDLAALATRGWQGKLHYFRSDEALGGVERYDRMEGVLSKSVSLWGNVVQLRASGGTGFQGTLPIYDKFTLGGPVSFPGLSIGQLRGDSYWAGSALYLHKIAEISQLFGQSLYLGTQLTAGDMAGRLDRVQSPTIYSGSVLVGGRTPLGPLTLSLSATTTQDWQIAFSLGRPIEERNILDPVW